MKKQDWRYLVDTLLFICIVGISFIGFLMGLIIPKGSAAHESAKYFLGLHRHQWGNIHFYLSIAFVILVIIHLVLSWSWVKTRARHIFKKGWAAALISTALLAVIVLVLFWLLYPKEPGAYEDYGVKRGEKGRQKSATEISPLEKDKYFSEQTQEYSTITGKMTLSEVAQVTGIPARQIADALNLPPDVSFHETLGRLREQHGFSMQDVREILTVPLYKHKAPPPSEDTEKERKTSAGEKHKEITPEEHEDKLTRGKLARDASGILINGQMTLSDIENRTGISARTVADKLGLPPDTPLDERLGRMGKIYFFSLQDVRDVVSSLMNNPEERHRNES